MKFDKEFNTKWMTKIEPTLLEKYKQQNVNNEKINSNLYEEKRIFKFFE